MSDKIKIVILFSVLLFSVNCGFAQSDFIEDIAHGNSKKTVENNDTDTISKENLPAFAEDSAIKADDTKANLKDEEAVCSYCGGSGYCEIAGERIPCPVCTADKDGAVDSADAGDGEFQKGKKKKSFPKVTSEERLPWDPVHSPSDPLPIKRGGEDTKKNADNEDEKLSAKKRTIDLNSNDVYTQSRAGELVFISSRLVPAASMRLNTLWGDIPFAMAGAYRSNLDRGPGFSINIPVDWKKEEKPHDVLGGTQHRYTSSGGLNYVVVVTFPMDDDEDLVEYLEKKHVKMLSSFKNISAQKAILGRRKGIACFYQGILLMRDVACNLFFTNYKNKGYIIYGLYFDRQGGVEVAQILNSLRIR